LAGAEKQPYCLLSGCEGILAGSQPGYKPNAAGRKAIDQVAQDKWNGKGIKLRSTEKFTSAEGYRKLTSACGVEERRFSAA
jgi:hypothetical protein